MEGVTTELIVIIISLVVTGVIIYVQLLKARYMWEVSKLKCEIEELNQIIKLSNRLKKEKK